MSDNRFDQSGRRVALSNPPGFFRWLLTDFDAFLRWRAWAKTRTTPRPGGTEQVGDLVAVLEARDGTSPPWLFLQEFQTEPDPKMFSRFLKQGAGLWEDDRPDAEAGSSYQLAGGVVYLTGTKQSLPASRLFAFPTDGLLWGIQVRERYLAEESADTTLQGIEEDRIDSCILPLISLMQGAGDSAIILRWIAAAERADADQRAEIGFLTRVLVELTDWATAWHDKLKEWNMRESQTILAVIREGEVKALRWALRGLLEKRFGLLDAQLVRRIEDTTDLDALKEGMDRILTIESPDELGL